MRTNTGRITTKEALKRTEQKLGFRPDPSTIHRWATKGKVLATKIGGRLLIDAESLDRHLTEQPIESRPSPTTSAVPNRGDEAAARLHATRSAI